MTTLKNEFGDKIIIADGKTFFYKGDFKFRLIFHMEITDFTTPARYEDKRKQLVHILENGCIYLGNEVTQTCVGYFKLA